ncbi:unnamed protein product [Acanthosepion pharaonis]|uniref:Ubiquitin-associated protein 1 n=1 Tax=Acanthosepion pharaonis TaxID=158019 RepID=A0A812BGG7_ACAPH|nr:unnamed protein product [Sepia pharaonis]
MDSDRSSRGIYGLASANSALDGIPFKIGGKFKVPNKVSIPKELLARRKCSALDDEYFFNTEEGVIHWAKAQQRMKESKEQVMRERAAAAAAAALNKQCLAEAEMKNQQMLMPVASEDVYANIPNMADKMLTPTPISQHQVTVTSNCTVGTDTNTNMSQFDVSQFEREDDPFEHVERQVINEFEELNQVFQKSAENSESPEGNYENVVVVSKHPPDAAAPPPLPPPPLPPPPGSAAAAAAAAAAASASAEHESPRHVPLGSQAAPTENSTAAAEPETTHVEISGNGPDENSEAEFDDENAIYGNLPCRKKSTTGSPKRKDSNNYVMVSYANGRLVRDASKRQAIAAARQSSLDEELKSKIVMSNSLNQKTCTVPTSVVSGNSEESMGPSPDATTMLNEGIYENMPVSSPDKNNYENCFLAQRSRHSVAFDGDSPVCPPAIPPRTDLAKLRGTHSTPNIHQASSGKDAKSVSPFKSPPSPMPRKQSWSRHPPVPPIRSRHNGQVSQSSVETSCSDDSPTDCNQVNDPFPTMSQEAQNFVQQYLSMGFPRARVARAVEKLGLDDKEVIDHLCMVDKLGEEGHDPQLVEDALHLFDNDIQKAECYIHLHQQFVELGFQRSKIQEALVTSKLDSDKALDLLTT